MKNWLINHFKASYLFDINPHFENSIIIFFTVLSCFLIIFAVVSSITLTKKSLKLAPYIALKDKIFNNFITSGIVGLLLTFVAWQEIPYLSTPILFIIFIIVIICQIVYIIMFYRKKITADVSEYRKEISYRKYLPKSKKIK